MRTLTSVLDNVKIASPCHANWNDMQGSDTVRFCRQCRLNVYNLSALSRDEALDLMAATEGKRCVRFFERSDGTILTRDCPVGWAAVKRRLTYIGTAGAAVLIAALGVVVWSEAASNRRAENRRPNFTDKLREFVDVILGRPVPMPACGGIVMGAICLPDEPEINGPPQVQDVEP